MIKLQQVFNIIKWIHWIFLFKIKKLNAYTYSNKILNLFVAVTKPLPILFFFKECTMQILTWCFYSLFALKKKILSRYGLKPTQVIMYERMLNLQRHVITCYVIVTCMIQQWIDLYLMRLKNCVKLNVYTIIC